MTYVKAIAVGLVTGLLVAVLYFAVASAVSLVRDRDKGDISRVSLLVAGGLGFVVGTRRTLRMAQKDSGSGKVR